MQADNLKPKSHLPGLAPDYKPDHPRTPDSPGRFHNLLLTMTMTTRIVCIRPRGRTQCVFPRFQHSCLYVYILTKSEFISSCSQPAVGSNIVQITRATFFVNIFKKMAAGSHFGCAKITLYCISYHFRSIPRFLFLCLFLQNDCRRPFWMSENHFRSHF